MARLVDDDISHSFPKNTITVYHINGHESRYGRGVPIGQFFIFARFFVYIRQIFRVIEISLEMNMRL